MNMYVHSFVIVPDLFRAVFHCAANPNRYEHKVNENFYTSVATQLPAKGGNFTLNRTL